MAKSEAKKSNQPVVGKHSRRIKLTPVSVTIVLVLLAVIGLLGYNKLQSGSFWAMAEDKTDIGSVSGVKLHACKNQALRRVYFFVSNTSGQERAISLQAPEVFSSATLPNNARLTTSYSWDEDVNSVIVGGDVLSVGQGSSHLGRFRDVSTSNIVSC